MLVLGVAFGGLYAWADTLTASFFRIKEAVSWLF